MTQLYTSNQVRESVTNDPMCNALYRAVLNAMETHELTPGEVRAIVVFAACEYEIRRMGTSIILPASIPPVDSRGSDGQETRTTTD